MLGATNPLLRYVTDAAQPGSAATAVSARATHSPARVHAHTSTLFVVQPRGGAAT